MKGTILVAEDENKIRNLIKVFLERDGYKVIETKSGLETINGIKKYLPDVIILDIIMPEMDGLEVCKEIRKDENCSGIPIIYLSNIVDKKAVIKGLEIGGDDYVTKPFDPNELVARVNAILRRYDRARQNETLQTNIEELTYQETKILQLIGKGYTNKEIAKKLSLTEGTVKVYNNIIFQKLHVKNRTQAIVQASERNLI